MKPYQAFSFRRSITGFTVLEMVMVIALLGVLIALLMPAVQHVRESARRTQCLDRLRQIGVAVHLHHDVNGSIPPRRESGDPSDPNRMLLWQGLILPYLDEQPLWETSVQACRIDPVSFHNPPHVANETVIPTYVCPSDSRLLVKNRWDDRTESFSSYLGVSGSPLGGALYVFPGQINIESAAGVFGSDGGVSFAQIKDGLSQTIMVGERPPPNTYQAGQWYSMIAHGQFPGPNGFMQIPQALIFPEDPCLPSKAGLGPGRIENPCDRFHFWSLHPGGANFLMVDGSSRFLCHSAAPVMPALATRDGGETVQLPW